MKRRIMTETDPETTRRHFMRLAEKKIAQRRAVGLSPIATAEDAAQAAMLADLEAIRRGDKRRIHSEIYRAIDEEIDRSISVAEVPTVVLRNGLADLTRMLDLWNWQGRTPDDLHAKRAAMELAQTLRRGPLRDVPADERDVDDVIMSGLILRALNELGYREREVVKLRYGIGDGYAYDPAEVGRIFKVTRERVRQIEVKAIAELQRKFNDPKWVRRNLIASEKRWNGRRT